MISSTVSGALVLLEQAEIRRMPQARMRVWSMAGLLSRSSLSCRRSPGISRFGYLILQDFLRRRIELIERGQILRPTGDVHFHVLSLSVDDVDDLAKLAGLVRVGDQTGLGSEPDVADELGDASGVDHFPELFLD